MDEDDRAAPYRVAGHYEGDFSRLNCDWCGEVFDVEGDVSNGDEYTCESCGSTVEVVGR